MAFDPPAPDPLVGRVIAGKFEIQSLLGGGGMGKVYKARHRALDKIIAIKVLHQNYQSDVKFATRFQREALSASKLDHPNGMQVLDFGQESDGLLYIAMEFLPGKDLHRILLDEGVPTLERIVEIMSQVCAALQAAHDQGIVHRDMKPENIVIVPRANDDGTIVDQVKVCDFGIAKVQDSRAYVDAADSAPLTTAGMVCGTPEFMSPEQARGLRLDARADIYSCGVVLFQMATGCLPFTGDSAIGVVMKQVMEAPPLPSSFNPMVAPGLEALILRALAKDPAARPQTARELRAALRALVAPGLGSGRVATAPFGAPPFAAASGIGVAATVQAPATPPQSLPRSAAASSALSTGPTLQASATPAPRPAVTPTGAGAAAVTVVQVLASPTAAGIELARPPQPARRGPARMVVGALVLVAALGLGAWFLSSGRRVSRDSPVAPVTTSARPGPVRTVEAPPPPIERPEPVAPVPPIARATEPTELVAEPTTTAQPAPTSKTVRRQSRAQAAVVPVPPPPEPEPVAVPVAAPAPAPVAVAVPVPVVVAPRPAPAPIPRPAPAPAPAPPAPGSLAARVAISVARWDGSSPRSTGSIAAGRLVGALEACYAAAAVRAGRNARGAVTVSLTIDENGRATGVRADGEPLPGVGSCVRTVMRRLAATRPDTGTVDASFRIDFTPRPR